MSAANSPIAPHTHAAESKQILVSAELTPLVDDLLTIFASLHRLASSGSWAADQLQTMQARIDAIEIEYKRDGIWCGCLSAGRVPAGQAAVNEIVDKCHDMIDNMMDKTEEGQGAKTKGTPAPAPSDIDYLKCAECAGVPTEPRRSATPGAGVEYAEYERGMEKPYENEPGIIEDNKSKHRLLDPSAAPRRLSASAHREAAGESEIEKRNITSAGTGMKASEVPERLMHHEADKMKADLAPKEFE